MGYVRLDQPAHDLGCTSLEWHSGKWYFRVSIVAYRSLLLVNGHEQRFIGQKTIPWAFNGVQGGNNAGFSDMCEQGATLHGFVVSVLLRKEWKRQRGQSMRLLDFVDVTC